MAPPRQFQTTKRMAQPRRTGIARRKRFSYSEGLLRPWWDWEGIIHWEILEQNQTLNAEIYVQQFHTLSQAVAEKRPTRQQHGVLLTHNNASPHVANWTRAAIEDLKWEVLHHTPTLQTWRRQIFIFPSRFVTMSGARFKTVSELKIWLSEFFGLEQKHIIAKESINWLIDASKS